MPELPAWVQIKDPEQPDAPAARVSKNAWLYVYKPMGWKLVKGDSK